LVLSGGGARGIAHSPDLLINISRDSCSTFDFYRAEELVEIGRHAAIESLNLYKNKIKGIN
jgi:NTE family protein